MISKLKFVWIILVVSSNTYGQAKGINDSIVNALKVAITNFFIDEGVLDSNVNTTSYVYGMDLVHHREIGKSNFGIYRIGVFQSHGTEHVLIKHENSFKIFNLKDLKLIFEKVLQFSLKFKLDNQLMVLYFKEIIKLYELTFQDFKQ